MKTKILIVDDSKPDVFLLTEYLKKMGINPSDIVNANIGEKAITLFEDNPTDFKFVLMDVQLPGKFDGYETTKKLMDIFPVPIIIESASYKKENPDVGYIGFLKKPYMKNDLFNILNDLKLI